MFWGFLSHYIDAVKDGLSCDASEAIGTIIAVAISPVVLPVIAAYKAVDDVNENARDESPRLSWRPLRLGLVKPGSL